MSVRLEMLQVARLAPKLLGDSTELVASFLRSQQNDDGGFKDRTGQSDLYYTVFGLDALAALQQPVDTERVGRFLRLFGNGADQNFVHLCALARCWAAAQMKAGGGADVSQVEQSLLARLATFRARDGGFNPAPGSEHGTAYGAFLAASAYLDLRAAIPDPLELVRSFKFLETSDGAWTNEAPNPKSKILNPKSLPGATNATAAIVTVLRNLGMPINPAVGDWLLARAHPQGGFLAIPKAPVPDLLSTATALHALAGMEVSFERQREPCLDFIDSLWTNEGSFHGNWTDDHLDCEYTFYALLALGHLSL